MYFFFNIKNKQFKFKGYDVKMFFKVLKWIVNDWFKVQEDRALHENKLFWLVVLVPLAFIGWVFWKLTELLKTEGLYNPIINAESLAGFVNYYAFPIALLTLPLTLALMINRFHSSKQKAKSNRLVEKNNTANNYFSHFNSFKEYCEQLEVIHENKSLKIFPQRLYQFIFFNSNLTNFEPEVSEQLIQTIISSIKDEIFLFEEHIADNKKDNNYGEYDRSESLFEGLDFHCQITSDGQLYEYFETLSNIYYDIFMFQGILNNNYIRSKFQEAFEPLIQEKFKIIGFPDTNYIKAVLIQNN